MSYKRSIAQANPYSISISLMISLLLLAGCGAPKTPAPAPAAATAAPTPTPQVILPTPAATIPAGPAATPTMEDTPTPTPELLPAATPVLLNPTPLVLPATAASAPGTIVFTPGTTAGVVEGTIQPGQVVTYTLQAGANQPLILIMTSPQNDVTLAVTDPNGVILLNPANKWTSWQAVLSKSGLYTINVFGGASVEIYDLTVKIAQLVNFASGTSSITLNGISVNGYPFDYALTCAAGQTMTASLNVPATTAYLDIFGGVSTTMLLLDTARANTWTGVLPQTQPYVVEVVPNNNKVVAYSLTISCTGSGGAVTGTGDIVIAPGSTAAVKHGTVAPGQTIAYTLQVSQYQPIVLNIGTVGTTNNNVVLGMLFPDGSTFLSPSEKYLNFNARIPVTGLWKILVVGGSTTENFELTVKLPRIVYFGADTGTVSIKSATEQGFIVSYAIYGNADQTLTASLDVSSDIAYLDVFGLFTGSLLSYRDKASSWSGTLPETQMYVIEVIPRGGWIRGYTLTLTLE